MDSSGSSPQPSYVMQEMGSGKKTESKADPPLTDLNNTPSPPVMCVENCDVCPILYQGVELEECKGFVWDAKTEIELEVVILGYLDAIFKSLMKRIISQGCTKEIARRVDLLLAFLENSSGSPSEKLRWLEKSLLHLIVSYLRRLCPFIRPGDAMWGLLLFDMNDSNLCARLVEIFDAAAVRQSNPESNSNNSTSLAVAAELDKPDPSLASSDSTKRTHCICLIPNCSVEAQNHSREVLLVTIQKLTLMRKAWEGWAFCKVEQATQRLKRDRAELEALRQEKEEATATVRRLEIENSELQQGMEASMLQAEEESVKCEEVLLRVKDTEKRMVSLEREVTWFREELETEKQTLSQLQQRLEQARHDHAQIQANLRNEEKLKGEALAEAESQRKKRERIEISRKPKEDKLKSKGERRAMQLKEIIRSLEQQIENSRPTADSSQLNSGSGDVHRDWECVICLIKERSVVFLPCAHQILCTKCNEIHENLGITDCPSCRGPIQRRIHVINVSCKRGNTDL